MQCKFATREPVFKMYRTKQCISCNWFNHNKVSNSLCYPNVFQLSLKQTHSLANISYRKTKFSGFFVLWATFVWPLEKTAHWLIPFSPQTGSEDGMEELLELMYACNNNNNIIIIIIIIFDVMRTSNLTMYITYCL
jgi:hypothetical protein